MDEQCVKASSGCRMWWKVSDDSERPSPGSNTRDKPERRGLKAMMSKNSVDPMSVNTSHLHHFHSLAFALHDVTIAASGLRKQTVFGLQTNVETLRVGANHRFRELTGPLSQTLAANGSMAGKTL